MLSAAWAASSTSPFMTTFFFFDLVCSRESLLKTSMKYSVAVEERTAITAIDGFVYLTFGEGEDCVLRDELDLWIHLGDPFHVGKREA